MRKIKLLVVEDDPFICELIALYGEREGHNVETAANGTEGYGMFVDNPPDLIILDVMLPGMDGWEFCREVRRTSQVPIIMLTGKGESYDRIKGLELGADDYMVKPFDPKELMARIKAVLRRCHPELVAREILEFPGLRIDLGQYRVHCRGVDIMLAPKEMELLVFMAANHNKVFTRQQLIDRIWGLDFEGDPRTVDVHIKRIREKLNDPQPEWSLKTIRGVGYKFEVNVG